MRVNSVQVPGHLPRLQHESPRSPQPGSTGPSGRTSRSGTMFPTTGRPWTGGADGPVPEQLASPRPQDAAHVGCFLETRPWLPPSSCPGDLQSKPGSCHWASHSLCDVNPCHLTDVTPESPSRPCPVGPSGTGGWDVQDRGLGSPVVLRLEPQHLWSRSRPLSPSMCVVTSPSHHSL